MGNRPSSYFGYGVAFSHRTAFERSDDPASPSQVYGGGEPCDGLAIVGVGYDDSSLLLVVNESLSVSDDWTPKAIAQAQMQARPEWADKINAYLDKWNLRSKVAKGFESPGFIHAPYYG